MKSSINALRQKLQQLDALHASGGIDSAAHSDARKLIERELVDAVMTDDKSPPSTKPAGPSARLWVGVVSVVLVMAGVGYSLTGSPQFAAVKPPSDVLAAPTPQAADDTGSAVSDAQVAEIVDRVAQRLKESPDDVAGWALLARAYSAMGRHAEAMPAYDKALSVGGDDATLLADYADATAANNNGRFNDQAVKLVQRALTLEPGNVKALALSGSISFDSRDYAKAVVQWEKVERGLPPESQVLAQVRASIAQARELGGLPKASPAAAPPQLAKAEAGAVANGNPAVVPVPVGAAPVGPTVAAAAARATAVSGSVTLAPGLAKTASPDDTVFILARAVNGPRMPLAVLRKQVKDLPLTFTLDDSMAMSPDAKISDHAAVVVSARISKTGDAFPQPGDLGGMSAPVAPGAKSVAVVISAVVGK